MCSDGICLSEKNSKCSFFDAMSLRFFALFMGKGSDSAPVLCIPRIWAGVNFARPGHPGPF